MTTPAKGARFARMITSYILILCLSTWMLVVGLSQAAKRLAMLLGPSAMISPALCVALPIIAFLAVVGAAPALLVAALLVLIVGVVIGDRAPTLLVRFGVPVLAALLAASSIHFPEIAKLPMPAMVGGAAMALLALLLAAEKLPTQAGPASMGVIAALLPLLAAPFMGAPSYIALDVALIVSGLLAALIALGMAIHVAPMRAPFAIITGWLIIDAAAHGAGVPAGISVLMYGGAIAYGLMREPTHTGFHAL
jgi:hypothetical protein